jgi:ribosomal protein S18 acetylase RimI-like enzyme
MSEIEIRPATSADITTLVCFDHSCETTHIWQMESHTANELTEISFRETRLPRALHLDYPRNPARLPDTWTKHSLFLVAREGGIITGYLILDLEVDTRSAKVSDLVISPEFRRKGIGSALVIAAQDWLKKTGITLITLEMLVKNHAAIEFSRKLKYKFNGFADNYFANHDIVVFFARALDGSRM